MDTLSTEGTTEVRPIVTRNSLAFSDSYTLNGKVLVIALDGATLDLIEPMMAEGILPNLAKMASQGADGKPLHDSPTLSYRLDFYSSQPGSQRGGLD
jgi:hypothetical protein